MTQRLDHHPEPQVATMRDLVAIAHAIEREAIRRYRLLSAEMERRGQADTAEIFSRLAAEEEKHVASVAAWAEGLGEHGPASGDFAWTLPPELGSSWGAARNSALLTPYRALAIAVANEERAFAFYAYVAAQATEPSIAAEAEKLAREELEHAALLRRWRRAAYRQSRPPAGPARPIAHDFGSVAALVENAEADIAACHLEISGRLEAAGDAEGAALLRGMARVGPGGSPPGRVCSSPDCRTEQPAALLTAALRPLESLSEILETVLVEEADEQIVAFSQERLESLVARIARIARHRESTFADRPASTGTSDGQA